MEKKSYEVVVTNSNWVVEQLEEITPVRMIYILQKLKEQRMEITKLSYDKAHEWYGNPLPKIVDDRIKKELKSIIGNGFSVIYLIAQNLY